MTAGGVRSAGSRGVSKEEKEIRRSLNFVVNGEGKRLDDKGNLPNNVLRGVLLTQDLFKDALKIRIKQRRRSMMTSPKSILRRK